MLGTIQPRAIGLYCVEEQSTLGAILLWVRNDRNRVARFVGHSGPALTEHEIDARRLDIPRSDSGGVFRVSPNRDDDVAVGILPQILFYDTSVCNISGYIEHRAGMVGEGRTSRNQQDSHRENQTPSCLLRLHLSYQYREESGTDKV